VIKRGGVLPERGLRSVQPHLSRSVRPNRSKEDSDPFRACRQEGDYLVKYLNKPVPVFWFGSPEPDMRDPGCSRASRAPSVVRYDHEVLRGCVGCDRVIRGILSEDLSNLGRLESAIAQQ
jgi:hypothetical protein